MVKYSSYKPSGIEWLETIPENWEVSKLKYLGNLFGGLTGKSGVDFNNARKLVDCGADVLVAGNTVFGNANPTEAIAQLKSITA